MNFDRQHIVNVVHRALAKAGISFESLLASSEQIVAFGSTVFGLTNADSDIDLLCLGFGAEHKSKKADVIWITPHDIVNRVWLESELATHVARYGVWLYGTDNWSRRSKVSGLTMDFKIKSIAERIEAIHKRSYLLHDIYLEKHAVRLRRDLQRLWLLDNKQPVIATSILDYTWEMEAARMSALRELFNVGHFRYDVLQRGYGQVSSYLNQGFISREDQRLRQKIEDWLSDHLPICDSFAWSQISWRSLK